MTQENLQQEKRSAQEVDYMLMHRLLSPVQSAMLILQARSAGCLRPKQKQSILPNERMDVDGWRPAWCRLLPFRCYPML